MRVPYRFGWATLLVLLFVAASAAQTGASGLARIVHTPAPFARVGEAITIEAFAEGADEAGSVVQAEIWFKAHNSDVYEYVEMFLSGAGYRGEIPGSEIVSEGVDYYIAFEFENGTKVYYPSSPSDAPPIGNPVQVRVRSAASSAGGSPLLIISPEPFARVRGEVLVAVAFNQSVRLLSPSKVRVKVNGKDRTQMFQVSEEICIGVLTGIKPGRVRVDIDYMGDSGLENLGNFTFTYVETGKQTGPKMEVSGSLSSDMRYQKINEIQQSIARETFGLQYRVGKFSILSNGLLTSEEQGHLQPQHRFTVDMGFPGLRIRAGDIKPKYNELVLWGKRVRGLEMAMTAKYLGLQMIYGYTSRSVEGYTTISETIDSTGVTTIDTTNVAGTYQRFLAATRLRIGNKDKVSFGITAMKSRDDTTSIVTGDSPKDNIVAGADFAAYFDRRKIEIKGEAGISITNDDISEPVLSDAKDFSDIIWINQYLDPLPDDGLTGDSLDMTAIAQSIIQQALSYKGRLRLRYLRNDVQVGYQSINRSFRSLGNTNLPNDLAGYYLRDRIRLIGNMVYLNGGYSYYFDNVTGKGDIRTEREQLTAGLSIYTGEYAPDLTFNYSNYFNKNDGELKEYEVSPADEETGTPAVYEWIDTRREDNTGSYDFSISQQFGLLNAVNNMTVSYMMSDRSDVYDSLGAQQSNGLSVVLRSEYEMPIVTKLTVSQQQSNSIGGLTDLTYQYAEFRTDLLLLNRKLIPYFSPRIYLASGNNAMSYIDPASYISEDDFSTPADYEEAVQHQRAVSIKSMIVDVTRIDWLAGFRWNVGRYQSLEGTVQFTSYLENSMYEYWNGESYDVNQEEVINDGYTVTQVPPNKRNDIIAAIQYSIRF